MLKKFLFILFLFSLFFFSVRVFFQTAGNKLHRQKPGRGCQNICLQSGKGLGNAYSYLHTFEKYSALSLLQQSLYQNS